MKKSAYYSDIFFAFLTTSVGVLCVFRFLRVGLVAACLFGVIAGVCSSLATAIVLNHKRNLHLQKAADEKLKDKFLLHLILLNENERNGYLCQLFGASEENGFLKTEDGNLTLPIFLLREVCPDDVLPILRQNRFVKRSICFDKISGDGEKFCKQNNVRLLDGFTLFSLAKEKNVLPQEYLSEEFFTKKKKNRFRLCFAKSNSRRFWVGGLFVLLSSLITPFPYYYLVVGFLLVGVAIFTRIFGGN